MSDLIKLRRGTATQWSTANPVLAAGECGFDMTNNQLRIGNGTSNWSALVPINASISASDILAALVTVDGTGSGLDADTVDGRNPGSANGLATLDSASKVTSGQLPAALAMITSGTGTPEGAVTASPGALFLRTDGGANSTLYRKETGTGNTGWVASKTTIADADIASSAAIALSKLATEPNNTVVGNVAGSTAVPTALTADDLQTIRNTIAFLLSTVVPSAPASAALHSEARARTLAWVTGPQGNKWPIGRAPWANTWTVIQTNNTAIRQDGHGTSSTTGTLQPPARRSHHFRWDSGRPRQPRCRHPRLLPGCDHRPVRRVRGPHVRLRRRRRFLQQQRRQHRIAFVPSPLLQLGGVAHHDRRGRPRLHH
jgi:hypothetical protein